MIQEAWRMFKFAGGFWKAHEVLSNYLGKTKDDSDLHPPIFVNLSFAGEIYLKCLLLIQTGDYPKKKEAHDLKYLFDNLPATDQSAVDETYKNEFKNSVLYRYCMTRKTVPKLSSVLDGAGETFVNMRYSFESKPKSKPKSKSKDQGPTIGLQEFIEAVRRQILAIKPDWRESE
jgi:hypothetical protein